MADDDQSKGTLLKDDQGNYFLIYDEALENARVGKDHLDLARHVDERRSESGFDFVRSHLHVVGHVANRSGKKLFQCGPDD